jgi:shikimate dehydrogenase
VTLRAGASSRLIALLGDPVSHSASPAFQNAAFQALGLDAVYLALRCRAPSLEGLLLGIARAGGGGNVTVPHKELAAAIVERRTDVVEKTGACNTYWLEGDRVWGDNTDVQGFIDAARLLTGGTLAGARVLLLGAGGAARGALLGLVEADVDEVVVVNRTLERADAMVRALPSGRSPRILTRERPEQIASESFDLAINATTVGMGGREEQPLSGGGGPDFAAAMDLVYAPGGTPWTRSLAERGIPVQDGTEMLLRQGAAAFQRWWGREAPLEVMRAALPGAER